MSEKNNSLGARYYQERKTTLLHAAIHEYVTTRSGKVYGLHPLFNMLSLCVQKPLLFVVFTRRVEDVNKTSSADCGWKHSFARPGFLEDKFNGMISDHLSNIDETKSEWILEPAEYDDFYQDNYEIYAVGVFYLHLITSVEGDVGSIKNNAGECLSPESTFFPLSKRDLNDLASVFRAIVNHRSFDEVDYSHKRHVEKYMQSCLRQQYSLFSVNNKGKFVEIKEKKKPIELDSTEDVIRFLRPIISGVDRLYCELRGGVPGVFDENNSLNAGSPLLWSRDRESERAGTGRRPLNIAFYMQVKAPNLKNSLGKEEGYRIIPIVTPSMCKDYAHIYSEHFISGCSTISEMRSYLLGLGVKNYASDKEFSDLLSDPDLLYKEIMTAVDLNSFLGPQFYHTYTFPAIASGLGMFLSTDPHSRADYVSHGPDYLREFGGEDTAFVLPLLVSGFAYFAVMTKSRTPLSVKGHGNKQAFEYNYNFLQGVVRRNVIRRVRSIIKHAYLKGVKNIIVESLYNEERGYSMANFNHLTSKYDIAVAPGWLERINDGLRALSQVMPFGEIQLTDNQDDLFVKYKVRSQKTELEVQRLAFQLFNVKLYVTVLSNQYFDRKIHHNDGGHLDDKDIERTITRALTYLDELWSAQAFLAATSNRVTEESK